MGEHLSRVAREEIRRFLTDQARVSVETDERRRLPLRHLVDGDGDRRLARLEVDYGDFEPFGAEIYARDSRFGAERMQEEEREEEQRVQ